MTVIKQALKEAYDRGYRRGFSFRSDETYEDGYQDGQADAIERITKLLEEHTITAKHGISPVGNSGWWERGMEYAIALIKEENAESDEKRDFMQEGTN